MPEGEVKNMTVSLYLSIKQDGTWKYLPAAWDGRKIRPHSALVNGRAKEFPGTSYYMRYMENGQRRMESVGNDPQLAVARMIAKEADLRLANTTVQRTVEVPAVVAPVVASQTLADAIKSYELYLQGSEKDFKTIQAYMTTLNGFQEFMKSGKMLHDVTKYDLLDFNLHLRSQKKPNSSSKDKDFDVSGLPVHKFSATGILLGHNHSCMTGVMSLARTPIMVVVSSSDSVRPMMTNFGLLFSGGFSFSGTSSASTGSNPKSINSILASSASSTSQMFPM